MKSKLNLLKSKYSEVIYDIIYIIVGTFLLAVGLNSFLVPLKLSSGGISSLATILYHLFGIQLSVTNLVCNAFLFVFGYRCLGKESVFKTVMGILFLSLFLEITSYFPAYTENMFASTLVGGILVGAGIGFVICRMASTGGSDFAALILNRIFPNISISNFILIIDSSIIILAGVIFKSITITVYSVISVYISIRISDFICTRGDAAKSIFILSDKSQQISEYIIKRFGRGVTGIYSKGMYLGEDKTMLMCVVRPRELHELVQSVRDYDVNAFIIISDVREVLGEGFKTEYIYDTSENSR